MVKNKKKTINPKNNDEKCFQYGIEVALNHEEIKSYREKISDIKRFSNEYNWKKMDFPSHAKDWKKFQSNNKSIVLNISYVPYSHFSKHFSTTGKQ